MILQTVLGDYEWIEDWAKIPETITGRLNGRTHGVVATSDGRVVICHQAVPSILIYDESANLESSWGDYPGAHGLTIVENDGIEYLWITDESSGKVVKATLDGREVMSLPVPSHKSYLEGKRYIPTWAAENPSTGDIWVADGYGESLVHRFSPSGVYLSTIDGTEGCGRFNNPHGINFFKNELFITDRINRRIVVYDNNGTFLRNSQNSIKKRNELHSPSSIDFYKNQMIVAELFTGIKILDAGSLDITDEIGANEFIHLDTGNESWWPPVAPVGWPDLAGTKNIRPGFFNSPHGACFTSGGDIYVVEWIKGGRIIKLKKQ
ncbi:MAG: NHL repeat-containing protein [Saccharofermentanales bacterium]